MRKNNSKVAFLGGMLAILASTISIPVAVQAGNWWAGPERSGSCYMSRRDVPFNCQFGSYTRVSGARQIGGFYVNPTNNPTNNVGQTGKIPLEYRINGGGWQRTEITMNATSGNYIDFGNGVRSFDFRFIRPDRGPLNGGNGTIYFKMNYDLDR